MYSSVLNGIYILTHDEFQRVQIIVHTAQWRWGLRLSSFPFTSTITGCRGITWFLSSRNECYKVTNSNSILCWVRIIVKPNLEQISTAIRNNSS